MPPMPNDAQILALHRKYASSPAAFDLVWVHCQVVLDIANQLMSRSAISVDRDIIRVGCMLHDIGVYQLIGDDAKVKPGSEYMRHGVVGAAILQDEGLPEVLQNICLHHTGMGLSKHDVVDQHLPLPVADYLAETDEELFIMYCDKFHSKTLPPQFNTFESYQKHVAQFGANKALKFDDMANKFGKPDLAVLSKTYGFAVR